MLSYLWRVTVHTVTQMIQEIMDWSMTSWWTSCEQYKPVECYT